MPKSITTVNGAICVLIARLTRSTYRHYVRTNNLGTTWEKLTDFLVIPTSRFPFPLILANNEIAVLRCTNCL